MKIVCVGISHQTATVEQREKFALSSLGAGETAAQLGKIEGVGEAVVLSTCNRVEFYAATENGEQAVRALNEFAGGAGGYFYELQAPESIRHLFRVVSGLESMAIGETEILGQVKKAYQAAVSAGSTGKTLNKFFQRAFNVAKEVRSKTNITRGPVSVGSVAVDLAEKIFGRLSACKVMILGAGETSESTARALLSRGAKSVFVSNRSHDRAVALAEKMNGRALRFDEWEREFHDLDILISSTAAPVAIVTRERIEPMLRLRKDRPLFIIDLAVPRDVDPAVNKLDGVYLYDIDSLQAIAQQSLDIRRQDMAICEEMIERHVIEFTDWLAVGHRRVADNSGSSAQNLAVS